jgi:hypothetical protein
MDTPLPFTLPAKDSQAVINFLRAKYPEFQHYRFTLTILRKQPHGEFDGFRFCLVAPQGNSYEKSVRLETYSWNTFIMEIERAAEAINREIWNGRSQELMEKLETLL